MKLHSLLPALLIAGNIAFGQNIEKDGPVEIIHKDYLESTTSVPTFIKLSEDTFKSVSELDQILMPYFKGKADLGLRLLKTERDNLGYVHYRYIQTYNDVDIEFAELMVHTKDGKIVSLNGKLLDSYPVNNSNLLTESAALDEAIDFIGATTYKWQIQGEEDFIKRETGNDNATFYPRGDLVYINSNLDYNASNYKLAYRFNIYAHDPMSRREIYISATNGSVLFQNQLIHTANVQGTASTAYSGSQTINTYSVSPNSFRLRQTVSGNGVNTYNLNQGTNYGAATDFTDSDNFWNNINTQKDEYATDAHWGAEQTYDYFFTVHGRNSINNAGFALNSYVHSADPSSGSANYANAFWDGQRMTYGDGSGGITPLVALDIAGHEIAHGLTTFSANLIYASESGALNESFSDIFGAAIEFYARPNRANWLIGEDINTVIRSMSNPRQYGDPDTRLGPSWLNVVGCSPSNQNDQCGVHINSGVQNKWFYLLTIGGSGTNGIGDSYSVRGTGIDTAAAVAFRNLTVYLGRNSNYDDARFFAIQSAKDLYGDCSPQVASVTDAWQAVGVGPAYVPYVLSDFIASDTTNCQAPFTVSFSNNSINGNTFAWDFGDGTTSTQRNPSHTYNSIGNFNVKLLTDGGACGTDSLERNSYIDIDTSLLCEITVNDGTNPTQFDCTGKLYDSGGPSQNYADNETGIITISPTGAATVSLSVVFFDVEAGSGANICDYDFLEVFDGPTVNSALIGKYCNSILPPASITSTSGEITIRFTSDGAVTEPGFEINWSCNLPTTPPVPNFDVDNTNSCLGIIDFEDKSTNAPSSWFWDFGDGNTSTLQNPVHTYAASGSYSVKLVASNGFGPDSITRNSIAIINRPATPTANDGTFCLGENIVLIATGSGTIEWYQNAKGSTAISNSNTLNINPVNVDTSFWVEDFVEAPLQSVGPTSNAIGGGNNFNNNQYLVFDVLQPMELKTVTVYAGTAGSRAIELRDASGSVIDTRYIYIPAGTQFVNLDFEIQPGQDYQLGVAQGSTISMFRNNSGTSYPYTLPGVVSIKRSSAGSNPTGFYYFFYNWQIKLLDCRSERIEVSAFIDSTCVVTGIQENAISGFELFPNPTSDIITLQVQNGGNQVEVEIYDVQGKLVFAKAYSYNGNLNAKIDLSSFNEGVYYVRTISDQQIVTKQVVVLK